MLPNQPRIVSRINSLSRPRPINHHFKKSCKHKIHHSSLKYSWAVWFNNPHQHMAAETTSIWEVLELILQLVRLRNSRGRQLRRINPITIIHSRDLPLLPQSVKVKWLLPQPAGHLGEATFQNLILEDLFVLNQVKIRQVLEGSARVVQVAVLEAWVQEDPAVHNRSTMCLDSQVSRLEPQKQWP